MLNHWKRSVVAPAKSTRQKSSQSLKQAKPQCLTIPKAMLSLCTRVTQRLLTDLPFTYHFTVSKAPSQIRLFN